MFIEYFIDHLQTDQEVKDTFKKLKEQYEKYIDYILIHSHLTRIAGYYFNKSKTNIAIDYPLGLNDTEIRLSMISKVANNCTNLSIQAPSAFLVNRKYDKIRREISLIKAKFPDHSFRYIIDYRKYNHNILAKFTSILMENNIDTIYPSTGFFIDNIYDNIVACKYLEQKSKIKTIFNANIWTKEHIELIIKSNPIGINLQNIHSLSLMKKYAHNDSTE
jgi:deoxyribose-phosphate aldolase|tara:strand:- start:9072 stop:9728 length:657 start_codon:yes stop_codon:yes gene_type:complete